MTRPFIPPSDLDPARDSVRASVEIAASPEVVFEALTDSEALAAWWGSPDSYLTRDWQLDVRPGGPWIARTIGPDGGEATVRGEYRVVDPPHVLEYTWQASWDGFVPTVVRCELAPAVVDGASGTRLTVTHTAVGGATMSVASHATHAIAWTRLVEWLTPAAGRARLLVGRA